MKMDLQRLINLILELKENSKYEYVRSEDECTFIRIDPNEPRLYAKTPLGREISFAPSYIIKFASNVKECAPFNISQLMNNSGSNRPVIETIVAHTREFYWIRKGGAIYVVWIPKYPHSPGELVEWTHETLPIVIPQNTHDYKRNIEDKFQQIFYGAPGTGKSYKVKGIVGDDNSNYVRTTFHPDTDYSTFVGAYKPTMVNVDVVKEKLTGEKYVGKEQKIAYAFVAQAFLKAYVEAWKRMAMPAENGKIEPFYLVIEEINRGNCAQIFGDLFQLLDRNDNGFSTYGIVPDSDIQNYLNEVLPDGLPDAKNDEGKVVVTGKQIKNGDIMILPSNLHILATMNTSDQSLFPIDSAFKRRWDWQYVPIQDEHKGWKITADGKEYDWWTFLEKINDIIGDLTSSEDKKLGYFFAKARDGKISAETFVSKVAFYLWNDVFKDYGSVTAEGKDLTRLGDKDNITFPMFFTGDAIDESLVVTFIQNVVGKELSLPADETTEPAGDDEATLDTATDAPTTEE